MIDSTKPEILRSDLSSTLLDLALWGVEHFEELQWLDTPNKEIIKESKIVLSELEMLDKNFKITQFGRDALSLGVHPRFAYMILKSESISCDYEASLLCALLGEKDILKDSYIQSDLLSRFTHLYERDLDPSFINTFRAKEVLKQADIFYKKFQKISGKSFNKSKFTYDKLAVLLLLAYPDRLAHRRAQNDKRYKLSNSKGAVIDIEDSLFNEEYLVVADLNAHTKDSYINQALSIEIGLVEEYFAKMLHKNESISYNKQTKKFDIREKLYFLELELSSKPLQLSSKHNMKILLLGLLKEEGLSILTLSKKAKALQDRVNFVNAQINSTFVDFSEKALVKSLNLWLEPYLQDVKSVKDLEALSCILCSYPI